MKSEKSSLLIKLPDNTQLTLYLIREELKTRRLFNTLRQIGFEDSYYQPNLDPLILRSVGLNDGTDETFGTYFNIMEKRSKKIDGDDEVLTKQALKAYIELTALRKKN